MKQKLVAAALVAAMAVSLVACGGSSSESASTETSEAASEETSEAATEEAATEASGGETKALSDLKLAFIVGTENDEFYLSVERGITAKCEELGIPTPTLADQELDGSKCTDLINNYVAAEYDAIAFSANDPAGTIPAMEDAIANGVEIFTFDCTVDDQYLDEYIAFVGSNNYAGGETAGEYVADVAPEGSTVGCITYASAQSTQDRQSGFESKIKELRPDLTLIESQDADNDQSKATDIMTNLITQYGDDLSYIFVVGDPTGYGALAAIQSAGANTKIVGFDANATALDYIADPTVGQIWVAEVAQDPEGIGSGIVEKIAEYYTNGAISGDQKDLIACNLITAENVDDYR